MKKDNRLFILCLILTVSDLTLWVNHDHVVTRFALGILGMGIVLALIEYFKDDFK